MKVLAKHLCLSFFLVLAVSGSIAAAEGVCARSPLVLGALRDATGKDCSQITGQDLASIKTLEIVTAWYSSNPFGEVSADDLAGLNSLQSISVIGLRSLPSNLFSNLGNLTTILISGTGTDSLPEDIFGGLEHLQSLSLGCTGGGSCNHFKQLPNGIFSGMKNLKSLDLNNNNLASLPTSLNELSNLKNLDLTHNNLTGLTDTTLNGLISLNFLDLRENNISSISDGTFENLKLLTELSLDSNEPLVSLSEKVIASLRGLHFLHLTGTGMSADQVKHIRSELPNVVIY